MQEKGPVQEILEKIDFYELVSRRVTLSQGKPSSYKGLSPFTNEKTPSFFINTKSNTWYDFSSGEGGGVLDYVMKTESLDKGGAVAFLAEITGVELNRDDPHAAIRAIIRTAAAYFDSHVEKAVDYMSSRGFSRDTLIRYSIGFAPKEGRELIDKLLEDGHSVKNIVDSGIGYKQSPTSPISPRFVNRVIFPIKDAHGTVVSFTGRKIVEGGNSPKYLHGPGTSIFRKKEVVWNLSQVRRMIAEQNMVIVCEGQLDALALCDAGLPGVAILGSSPSHVQLKLLAGASQNIYFMFDSDDAGEKALLTAFRTAEEAGVDSVLFATVLPEGEDPQSFIKSNGRDAIVSLLENSYSDTSVIIRSLIKQNLKDTRTKAQVASLVIDELAPFIKNRISYRGLDLLERASQEFSVNQTELRRLIERKNAGPSPQEVEEISFDAPIYERRILFSLLDNPEGIYKFRKSGLTTMDFESELISRVVDVISPTSTPVEVFDKIKTVTSDEEYQILLEFYSKGMDEVALELSLGVMRGMVNKRERSNSPVVDFLGRPLSKGTAAKKRKELRERLGH